MFTDVITCMYLDRAKIRFLSCLAILLCQYEFDWPFLHVHVSSSIIWSAILEKCTDNGQWPPVTFGSVLHRYTHMYMHTVGVQKKVSVLLSSTASVVLRVDTVGGS